jgi:actin-related protein
LVNKIFEEMMNDILSGKTVNPFEKINNFSNNKKENTINDIDILIKIFEEILKGINDLQKENKTKEKKQEKNNKNNENKEENVDIYVDVKIIDFYPKNAKVEITNAIDIMELKDKKGKQILIFRIPMPGFDNNSIKNKKYTTFTINDVKIKQINLELKNEDEIKMENAFHVKQIPMSLKLEIKIGNVRYIKAIQINKGVLEIIAKF